MKYILVILSLLLLVSLGQAQKQMKHTSEKAVLYSFSGLGDMSAGKFNQGIGARYSIGADFWLRGSLGYVSSDEGSDLNASVGAFKELFWLSNTIFSAGLEFGSSGEGNNHEIGILANIMYLPWDDVGLALDSGFKYERSTQTWSTRHGGKFTLTMFF